MQIDIEQNLENDQNPQNLAFSEHLISLSLYEIEYQ